MKRMIVVKEHETLRDINQTADDPVIRKNK